VLLEYAYGDDSFGRITSRGMSNTDFAYTGHTLGTEEHCIDGRNRVAGEPGSSGCTSLQTPAPAYDADGNIRAMTCPPAAGGSPMNASPP
jgi:hypothetical protein